MSIGHSTSFLTSAWEVFLLFAIPIGGGIPAGVLLAKSRGIAWPVMTVLYFLSDVALACVFEPIMKLMIMAGTKSKALSHINAAFRKSTQMTIAKYGVSPRPFTLVMIAFGVDPMTGRAATKAAGHGFVSGWALAIAGDMMFYTVIMVSTLWLNNLLGDGTSTALIIMLLMIVVPELLKRLKRSKSAS